MGIAETVAGQGAGGSGCLQRTSSVLEVPGGEFWARRGSLRRDLRYSINIQFAFFFFWSKIHGHKLLNVYACQHASNACLFC